MRFPSNLPTLTLVLCLAAAAAACSDGGSKTGDGGGSGGGGGSTGSGGSTGTGGTTDAGGADAGGSCPGPLAQASSICQSNLTDQIASGPQCDGDFMPVTRTCGTYKVWVSEFIGSQTCVYDAAGTNLLGARDCDSAFTATCPSGCYAYGLAESAYTAGCGADTPACP